MVGKCTKRQTEEMDKLSFLPSAIKEGRRSRRKTPDAVSTAERQFLNLVCPLLLLIPKGTSQFLIHFVPVVGFFKIHLFCHFLSKPWLTVRHRTACFPNHYTLLIFKYGTPHIELVYAHQASLLRVLEARGTHIFLLFPPFCSKKIETSCVRMT